MQIRLPKPIAAALVALLLAGCRSAPPYEGLGDADIHALAEREAAAGNHDDAIEALIRLFNTFPNYERSAEARLLLAESYVAEREYITAASEYQRFLDRYPSHARAPEAALGMCRAREALSPDIQRDQTPSEEALVVCRNVVADYEGTPVAEEAAAIAERMRLKLAEKLYQTGAYYFRRDFNDSAIIYWEMVETQYPDTAWTPRALMGILRAYQEIGYEDLVEETRQKILSGYPDSPEALELADGVPVGDGTGP